MKRLLGFLMTILILYVVYIDFSVGTLPSSSIRATSNDNNPASKPLAAFKAEVKPGETVISIVEHQLNQPLPVPISDLIKDFKLLNPGLAPENIQVGASYFFPDYSK